MATCLRATQSLGTNFNAARLTGACIKDWNTNSRTNLQDVRCKYIFGEFDSIKQQFTDRRPHDIKRNFAVGEFTKRYQKVLEMVELFFEDEVNWKAFLASLQDFQNEFGCDLSLQEMRQGYSGGLFMGLGIPPELDKGLAERWIYEQRDKLEAERRDEIKAIEAKQDEKIAAIQDRSEELLLKVITVYANSGNKAEEKSPVEKPKQKWWLWPLLASASVIGTGLTYIIANPVATLKQTNEGLAELKKFSDMTGIPLPFRINSDEPEQLPAAPSPSSSPFPSP